MGRTKGVDGSQLILKTLAKGPKTIRQLQKETGLNWSSIYYWLRDKKNQYNLVLRGCVKEERIVDETSNRAQDMFRYRITDYGLRVCLIEKVEDNESGNERE